MAVLLMSLDLEDARLHSVDGQKYPSRVEKNIGAFVQFLKERNWPCTFFTVGNIFENHPEMIAMIKKEGFEIGWHSSEHAPVAKMTEGEFYRDLMKGKEIAAKLGIVMRGYRAPNFSVTPSVHWFHSVLSRAGFDYSSSVLPAANPLFGWPNYGELPRIADGVLEIPMPLADLKLLKIPFGGVYLRALPNFVFNCVIRYQKRESAIATYLHPYDYDTEQERFSFGGVNNNAFYNFLMYFNRKKMLGSLENLAVACNQAVFDYSQFYEKFKASSSNVKDHARV